jgi:hypothetical protein
VCPARILQTMILLSSMNYLHGHCTFCKKAISTEYVLSNDNNIEKK